jgi:dihydroxyacetone kinase-like predicted kinase
VKKGKSLIVVGDKETIRVHVHTLDPGEIIHFGSSFGTLHQVSIRNMDEQHEAYLEMQRERMPLVNIATVSVVPGDGLTDIFNSLGVTAVVAGGQTMNPSTKDLLRAVESVASDKVFILPNNKNIIPVARQLQSLTKKKVEVIQTETVPQGVAALLAFDYEADFETNTQRMELARGAVKTVEIARAVRTAKLGGVKIKKNQFMGFLDGELEAVANDAPGALDRVLEKVDLTKALVVTIYRGADVEEAEATQVSDELRKRYPQLQIETVNGGQPHYNYIVSVE